MISIPFIEQKLIDDIEYYNFSLIKNLEAVELILYICKSIIDYLQDNVLQMSYDNITVNIYDSIFDLYKIQLEDIWYLYSTDTNNKEDIINSLNNDIYNCILVSNNIIYKYFIPVRSYPTSFIRVQQNENKKNNLDRKISMLKNIPQPEQRTEEWYKFRHTTLTASSIWKIFYSESSQNQLIYEKCKPLEIINNTSTNIDTPFHWGQKYEPLSVLYYQYIYNTIVDDFGCIPHSEYEYIAASPDGINCKRDNERYGRMLEIKNIVNRDITGIPKMEYWIQMQIQMETCDLNECDFLETRFIQYTTIEEFTDDPDFLENSTSGINSNGKDVYRGYILHFEGERGPKYEYHDFGMSLDEIKIWEQTTMKKYPECSWVQTLYWKLSEISCVLVLRNKLWFNKAVPNIELLWNIIKTEKHIDYSHRQPKKRVRKEKETSTVNNINTSNGCLLDLDL